MGFIAAYPQVSSFMGNVPLADCKVIAISTFLRSTLHHKCHVIKAVIRQHYIMQNGGGE